VALAGPAIGGAVAHGVGFQALGLVPPAAAAAVAAGLHRTSRTRHTGPE